MSCPRALPHAGQPATPLLPGPGRSVPVRVYGPDLLDAGPPRSPLMAPLCVKKQPGVGF